MAERTIWIHISKKKYQVDINNSQMNTLPRSSKMNTGAARGREREREREKLALQNQEFLKLALNNNNTMARERKVKLSPKL